MRADGNGTIDQRELRNILNMLILNQTILTDQLRKGSLVHVRRELKTADELADEILSKFDADKDRVM